MLKPREDNTVASHDRDIIAEREAREIASEDAVTLRGPNLLRYNNNLLTSNTIRREYSRTRCTERLLSYITLIGSD